MVTLSEAKRVKRYLDKIMKIQQTSITPENKYKDGKELYLNSKDNSTLFHTICDAQESIRYVISKLELI